MLVGKEYPIQQSVGKGTWLPQQTVGRERPMVGPTGCWSGKIFHSHQAAGWESYVGRERVFPSGLSPTDMIGRQQSFLTDCLLTEFVFPTNSLLGLPGGFPDRLCDRVCFPDQLFIGPCISFLRQTMRWFFRFAHKHPIALNSLDLRCQQNINQVSYFIKITCMS